jgi:hypothetical protein
LSNFEAKDLFAVTIYIIGRFFSALAARERVKTLSFSTWQLVSFFVADLEHFYA